MTFEELQKTWQQQPIPDTATIKEEMLLSVTRRNQQDFVAAVLRRDFREVAVCILLVAFFLQCYVNSKSMSMLIMTVGCIFVGSFFIVDRHIQKKRQPVYGDTLTCCLKQSLNQVNHQIWLLRNVLWWYLLPIGIGMLVGPILETGVAGLNRGYVIVAIFEVTVFCGVYRINQHAVLYGLLPRRYEILTLLNQLDPDRHDQTEIEPAPTYSKANKIIDGFIAILLGIIALAGICFIVGSFISARTHRQSMDISEFSNQSQQLATVFANPNQHDRLIIIEARYGCGHHWVDVTQAVTEAVDGNSLTIHPTNDWAGDPCFGKAKSLVVHYVYNGKQETIQSQGWLKLDLSAPPDMN